MKDFLTGIIFLVLLIWGPIDHEGKFGMAIRFGYLIFIPLIVRFFVGLILDKIENKKPRN